MINLRKERILKELKDEYDRRRTYNSLELSIRVSDVYTKIPRIKEIDGEIARIGVGTLSVALTQPENAQTIADGLRERLTSLTEEKEHLLKEGGIPKKYMELHHECQLCSDTGYISGGECKCLRMRRIEKAYNMYALKDKLLNETFSKFDLRYYSHEPFGPRQESPRDNMESVFAFCKRYTEHFSQGNNDNILFYGKPGLGKTFLCNAISKELMDLGYSVMYLTAFIMFKTIEEISFGRAEAESSIMEDLLEADLLVIDDLGTEFRTMLTDSSLFNIINLRANSKKPVIVSTNIMLNQLAETYSERILSRITNSYTCLEFYGSNVGTLKKRGEFLS